MPPDAGNIGHFQISTLDPSRFDAGLDQPPASFSKRNAFTVCTIFNCSAQFRAHMNAESGSQFRRSFSSHDSIMHSIYYIFDVIKPKTT